MTTGHRGAHPDQVRVFRERASVRPHPAHEVVVCKTPAGPLRRLDELERYGWKYTRGRNPEGRHFVRTGCCSRGAGIRPSCWACFSLAAPGPTP